MAATSIKQTFHAIHSLNEEKRSQSLSSATSPLKRMGDEAVLEVDLAS
jgi:hypothetical protein